MISVAVDNYKAAMKEGVQPDARLEALINKIFSQAISKVRYYEGLFHWSMQLKTRVYQQVLVVMKAYFSTILFYSKGEKS